MEQYEIISNNHEYDYNENPFYDFNYDDFLCYECRIDIPPIYIENNDLKKYELDNNLVIDQIIYGINIVFQNIMQIFD